MPTKARLRLEPMPASPSKPVLHLASQSARRRDLLTRHGIAHSASHPGIDDGLLLAGPVSPAHWVASLAYLKAAAGLMEAGNLMVLGADTVCVKGERIIGQPLDADDARRILKLLENGSHEVVTGVALLWPGSSRREIFVDRATVHLGPIGVERIDAYVASGEWAGKAGAYNLSERLAAGWPVRCDGDPSTVMGLPMQALQSRLAKLGATVSGGSGTAA
jgi:septum formation protein